MFCESAQWSNYSKIKIDSGSEHRNLFMSFASFSLFENRLFSVVTFIVFLIRSVKYPLSQKYLLFSNNTVGDSYCTSITSFPQPNPNWESFSILSGLIIQLENSLRPFHVFLDANCKLWPIKWLSIVQRNEINFFAY